MNSKRIIAGEIQEAWTKLNAKWHGEPAEAFYREYILRLSEISESFEDSCASISDLSAKFSKELQALERSLAE